MTFQRFLGACALAVVSLLLSPARAAECVPVGASIDVLTYNTWGLPAPISKDRRVRLPSIARMVRQASADLVGLQEVWRGALPFLDLDLVRPRSEGDSGLALVTPHRVSESREISFADAYGIDRLKQKGALATRVELPGAGPSWVVVTHLQAGSGQGSARARASQVDELIGLIPEDQGPVVMVGDFNLYQDNQADRASARRLAGAGWTDVAEASGALSPTYPDNGERFDRIFVRSGASACLAAERVEVVDVLLSDHLPVRATLRAGHPDGSSGTR